MINFTILGSTGFIGSRMVEYLKREGIDVAYPGYQEALNTSNLGHIIYCIGLTADFRYRPYDTMDAHVGLLAEVLKRGRFQSLLYLSSTRVYGRSSATTENTALTVNPASSSDLYNISKLAGETLCLNDDNPEVRVARLSNVFGSAKDGTPMAPDNFLAEVTRNAAEDGHIPLRTSPDSSKDYVAVEDVVRALRLISKRGKHRLYNVAAGKNVTNREISEELAQQTGASISIESGAPTIVYPIIDTSLLDREFSDANKIWRPIHVIDQLADIVSDYRAELLRCRGGLK